MLQVEGVHLPRRPTQVVWVGVLRVAVFMVNVCKYVFVGVWFAHLHHQVMDLDNQNRQEDASGGGPLSRQFRVCLAHDTWVTVLQFPVIEDRDYELFRHFQVVSYNPIVMRLSTHPPSSRATYHKRGRFRTHRLSSST